MGVIAGVCCDKCGAMVYWPHSSKHLVVRWAREKGWSLGKQTLCPKCRASKKTKEN